MQMTTLKHELSVISIFAIYDSFILSYYIDMYGNILYPANTIKNNFAFFPLAW